MINLETWKDESCGLHILRYQFSLWECLALVSLESWIMCILIEFFFGGVLITCLMTNKNILHIYLDDE